jgi:hypothetical protein
MGILRKLRSKMSRHEAPQRFGSDSCVDVSLQCYAVGSHQPAETSSLLESFICTHSVDRCWIRLHLVLLARQLLGKELGDVDLCYKYSESENVAQGDTF